MVASRQLPFLLAATKNMAESLARLRQVREERPCCGVMPSSAADRQAPQTAADLDSGRWRRRTSFFTHGVTRLCSESRHRIRSLHQHRGSRDVRRPQRTLVELPDAAFSVGLAVLAPDWNRIPKSAPALKTGSMARGRYLPISTRYRPRLIPQTRYDRLHGHVPGWR